MFITSLRRQFSLDLFQTIWTDYSLGQQTRFVIQFKLIPPTYSTFWGGPSRPVARYLRTVSNICHLSWEYELKCKNGSHIFP